MIKVNIYSLWTWLLPMHALELRLCANVLRSGLVPILLEMSNNNKYYCLLDVSGVYFWLCYGVGSILGVGPLYLLETLKAEQWNLGKDKPGLFDTDDTDTDTDNDIETNTNPCSVWKSVSVVLLMVSVNKPLHCPVFVRNGGRQTSTSFLTHMYIQLTASTGFDFL